jgi:multidrug efflux pump subunit AcrA (membrane-fusion protein)
VGVPLTQTTSSSQLVAADANVKATEREIESARARVVEAQSNFAKVSADLKRMELLIAKDEISHQQYDATVAAYNSAKANVDAATAAVAGSESRAAQAQAQAEAARTVPEQLKVTRARAGAATADVQKYISALAQAELNLKYTKIYAPVTGVLSKRSVDATVLTPEFFAVAKKSGFTILVDPTQYDIPFPQLEVLTSRAYLKTQPDIVTRYMRAIVEGVPAGLRLKAEDVVDDTAVKRIEKSR